MTTLTLSGNPISTNSAYRSHGNIHYMTKQAKSLKNQYIEEASAQWTGKPFSENLKIEIRLFFGDKRTRDWDNYHKISMDSLTNIVWNDDSQIKLATVTVGYDKKDPRIEVDVWPLTEIAS